MTHIFKCLACGEQHSFASHHAALQAGWTLAQVQTKDHVVYVVTCDRKDCVPEGVRKIIDQHRKRKASGGSHG